MKRFNTIQGCCAASPTEAHYSPPSAIVSRPLLVRAQKRTQVDFASHPYQSVHASSLIWYFFLNLCPRSASLQSYALLALSRARLITTIQCQASTSSTAMSATEPCAEILSDIALPKHELLEIHRSRICFITQKQVTFTQRSGYHISFSACWPFGTNLSDYIR